MARTTTADLDEYTPARRYLTVLEAAKALNISDRTVKALLASGELRAVRIGSKLVRIPADALAEVAQPYTLNRRDVDEAPRSSAPKGKASRAAVVEDLVDDVDEDDELEDDGPRARHTTTAAAARRGGKA